MQTIVYYFITKSTGSGSIALINFGILLALIPPFVCHFESDHRTIARVNASQVVSRVHEFDCKRPQNDCQSGVLNGIYECHTMY